MESRIRLAPQVFIRGHQNLKIARQILFAELPSLLSQTRAFVRRGGDQFRVRAADAGHQQIAKMPNGFTAEVLQILPIGNQLMNQSQSALRGTSQHGSHQFVKRVFGHHAQLLAHLRVADFVAAVCNGLFEQGQRITQTSFRRSRQHGQCRRLDLELFFRGDVGERRDNFRERQRAELKNCARDFSVSTRSSACVVASMKTTLSGGSSSVFSKALDASSVS